MVASLVQALPGDLAKMIIPMLAPEEAFVLEIWGDLLENKGAAVPRDKFENFYLWGKQHGFFPNAEKAFSETAWQLLG